jgi:hypothetical protein
MTAQAAVDRRRWSLPQLALLVPWVAVVIGAFQPVRDNSFLWHIRAGDLQVDSGAVLTRDPFSFTRFDEPWLTQSWLADVTYSWLHVRTDLLFTPWMLLILGLTTITLAAALIHRISKSVPATAILTFLTAVLLVPVMVPRPVIFTFPLLLLVVIGWENPKLRWTLPFVLWIWASVHGSFFIGLLYMFLRWIGARDWRAWPVGIVSGIATLLTAHGMGAAVTVITFLSLRDHLENMMEWQTPDLLSVVLFPFVIALFIVIAGAMKGRVRPNDYWVLVPFTVLALSANRGVFPAWLALLPLIARALGPLEWKLRGGFPTPVAAVFALVVVLMPIPFARRPDLDATRFPLSAESHLLDLRTFHDDGSGGYFIYSQKFAEGVYIDDRVELYRDMMEEFVEVRAGREDWRPVFDEWAIEQVLAPAEGPLHRLLVADGWREYFRDEQFVVLR